MGISCYDIKDAAMICFLLLFSEQDVKVKWQRDSTGRLPLHSDVNLGECLGNANKTHLNQSNLERTYQWSGWICNETIFQMYSTMVWGCLAVGLQTCPPLTRTAASSKAMPALICSFVLFSFLPIILLCRAKPSQKNHSDGFTYTTRPAADLLWHLWQRMTLGCFSFTPIS